MTRAFSCKETEKSSNGWEERDDRIRSRWESLDKKIGWEKNCVESLKVLSHQISSKSYLIPFSKLPEVNGESHAIPS